MNKLKCQFLEKLNTFVSVQLECKSVITQLSVKIYFIVYQINILEIHILASIFMNIFL